MYFFICVSGFTRCEVSIGLVHGVVTRRKKTEFMLKKRLIRHSYLDHSMQINGVRY